MSRLRYYTGIGARITPPEILKRMTEVAAELERKGFVLRSGGADGADKAFEAGVIDSRNKDILTPRDSIREAEEIASRIHPAWGKCNWIARKCHGRNVMQVLGRDLKTPSEFVIAWTPKAELVGGTRTALVVAAENMVPTFNLADPNVLSAFAWDLAYAAK